MRKKVDEFLAADNDEDLARELGYYVLGKMEATPYAKLTRPEQVIACLTGLEMEVNNGGFDQFYWNSPGDLAIDAVAALEELGAAHTAGLVKSANAVFAAKGPDPDRDKRGEQMDALPDSAREKWSALDDEFYEYRDNLSALAAAYMRKHATRFSD